MTRPTTTGPAYDAAVAMSEAEKDVRRLARQAADVTERLHEAMARMRAEGRSLRDIATAAGSTAPTVAAILRRRGER